LCTHGPKNTNLKPFNQIYLSHPQLFQPHKRNKTDILDERPEKDTKWEILHASNLSKTDKHRVMQGNQALLGSIKWISQMDRQERQR
jgi:hypothetical protein